MNNEYGKPLIKVFPSWGKEFSLTFNKFPSKILRLLCPKIALLVCQFCFEGFLVV